MSVLVDTQGTALCRMHRSPLPYSRCLHLRPTAIIREPRPAPPIYRQLAAYGHMGREELGVQWEQTDKVEALKAAVL